VAFIDSDDWYVDDALETLFQGVSKTGAVCGLVCKVYPNGKQQEIKRIGGESTINYASLKKGNPIAMSATMFDIGVVRRVGGIDPSLLWIEDYDFHLRIAKITDFYYIRKVIAYYTVYESMNLRRTYHYAKWSGIVWRKHGFINSSAVWQALTSAAVTVLLAPFGLLSKTRRKNKRVIKMEYIQILVGYIVGLAIGYPPRKAS
jgi:GT2 family glycosyltransferase